MRENLFKGKRKDNGEWTEGNLFVPDLPDSPTQICIGTDIIRITYDIFPETAGQYTGLTVDGKNLFEGDIIKCRHEWAGHNMTQPTDLDALFESADLSDIEMKEQFENQKIRGAYGKHTKQGYFGQQYYYYRNYVVEYYKPNGRYRVRNGSVFHDLTSSFISNREAIIVGNIYDNPELLKGGE